MCGRYSLYVERDIAELNRIIAELIRRNPDYPIPGTGGRTAEIYPSSLVPVFTAEQGGVAADCFIWGFPGFQRGRDIINARSETAAEKPSFRDCVKSRRCVIPTTGFYEWSHSGPKKKYHFTLADSPLLYLAGLYQAGPEGRRFVILTAPANGSMEDIHDRMPVILLKEELEPWIFEDGAAGVLLQKKQPALNRQAV